jgi:thymidine phosphorylase
MDIKVGSGAFAPSLETAGALGESLLAVAADAGLRTTALLTDMSQALGHHVGNALEVFEAIEFLTGTRREARLHAVTSALASDLLVLGGLARDDGEGVAAVDKALASGAAAERFAKMVKALGGPANLVEHPGHHLARAPVELAVAPETSGVITRIDARTVGLVVAALGGGRQAIEDLVDPAVGLTEVRGIGERVGPDRPIAVVYARSRGAAEAAAAALRRAVSVGSEPVSPATPVLHRMGSPSAT